MNRLRLSVLTIVLGFTSVGVWAQDVGDPVTFAGQGLGGSYGLAGWNSGRPILLQSGPSDPFQTPYDSVLFHGILPSTPVQFELSRIGPSGAWGTWRTAHIHQATGGRFWAKVVFPALSSGPLQLRVVGAGPGRASTLTLYAVEVFDGSKRTFKTGPGGAGEAPPVPDGPAVIGRAAWDAHPPKEDFTPHVPVRFTQHHTAGRRPSNLTESLQEVRFIQDFHQNGRGWNDIGYHYLIDPEGRIIQGRPVQVLGAHVAGHNDGNIGIVLLGFYHSPYNHTVTPQQFGSLKVLGRWLMGTYGIDAGTYHGHRDLGHRTDCPGDILYGMLDRIRNSFTEPEQSPVGAPPLLPESLMHGLGAGGPVLFDGLLRK